MPAHVEVCLDLRDHEHVAAVARALDDAAARSATAHDCTAATELETSHAPVPMDAGISDRIERATRDLALPYRRMRSGAGHDAQLVAQVVPTGMIFVPSRDGRSHSVLEHTAWSDVEAGANVLLATVHGLCT